jgi:hypothetical protein
LGIPSAAELQALQMRIAQLEKQVDGKTKATTHQATKTTPAKKAAAKRPVAKKKTAK